VDGRCGQLLGHAAARGLPWVRAWLASLLVWEGHRRVSAVEPWGRALALAAASAQLDEACSHLSPFLETSPPPRHLPII